MQKRDENTKQIEKKSAATQPKKLGLRELVKVEARVRSGCSKEFTNNCGINYRQS